MAYRKPFLLALTWGEFWRAGAILGITLALLLHVTIALLGLTLLYQVLERVATRYKGTPAGAQAAMLLAQMRYDEGQTTPVTEYDRERGTLRLGMRSRDRERGIKPRPPAPQEAAK